MSEEPATAEPIDHARLLAEIDEEVARRRASGALPADFERDLDVVFARYAPVHAIGDDLGQVLERAESLTFVDVLAPTDSALPLVPHVKRVVRKAITWELRHTAQQVSAYAAASVRALRLLAARVEELERATGAGPAAGPAAGVPAPAPDRGHWLPVLAAALAGLPGRVLHAEADDGWLVAGLGEAGVDAYGVDPWPRPARAGVEVREDAVVDHLGSLPAGSLGGVVLSGCVDRLGLAGQRELAGRARAAVAAGGAVVVLGTHPRAAALGRADPVAADLAPGRPLHAATWAHLLGSDGGEVVDGPRSGGLRPVPGSSPDLAANLRAIDEALFPPAGYALVVRLPR